MIFESIYGAVLAESLLIATGQNMSFDPLPEIVDDFSKEMVRDIAVDSILAFIQGKSQGIMIECQPTVLKAVMKRQKRRK